MIESGRLLLSPIFIPRGFKFSATTAGLKASGRPDLAVILADQPASAAALFTKNRIVAAPVHVGRRALSYSGGRVRAVIVNSGNANCATGKRGIRDCQAVCAATAKLLHGSSSEVFPSSTGIIGAPFPAAKIISELGSLLARANASTERLREFAHAILTTDSRPKLASTALRSGKASITGVAKGSGMIHPQLATMLVFVLTDVIATPSELSRMLRIACDESFNTISVDGDTSTNDTVLLLASGCSGIRLQSVRGEFKRGLLEVCQSLGEQIVSDGEGVQHVIHLRIEQARSRSEALQVAHAISHSLLVKTAWAGADPNWGRILAAIGRCGVPINPAKVSVLIGDQTVCRGSVARKFDERLAHEELLKAECRVVVRLGRGKALLNFLTTDLTQDYVKINADYST